MLENKKIAIYDFGNLSKRCLYAKGIIEDNKVNYPLLKWIIFNTIYRTNLKLKVNACILADDNGSWRKLIYPAYKADRKISNNANIIDWKEFYEELKSFITEMSENLPFYYISVKNAEADDIIATLVKTYFKNDWIIVSADSDFQQIDFPYVKLYDPMKSKFIDSTNSHTDWVNELAIKGQLKDNIYNILTPVDFDLSLKGRKPVLSSKIFSEIFETSVEDWYNKTGKEFIEKKNVENKEKKKPLLETNPIHRFKVNKKILDLFDLPPVLEKSIIDNFECIELSKSEDFYPYFKKMGWNSVLDDFVTVEGNLYKLF